MQRMMRQVQKMQADMERVQEEVATRTVDATVGGGVVSATCNGKGELVALRIDPSVVDPADVSMLTDLLLTAVNQALHKAQEMLSDEMKKVTSGVQVPGGLKLP